MKNLIIFLLLFTSVISAQSSKVLSGADVLLKDSLHLIENKNIGIITNHTGILSNSVHIVDTLNSLKNVNVVVLFGPEHGIRGDAPDGQTITDGKDSKTGIQVYSLYGKTRKPTPEMLESVDLLIFDIQDIGARYYTYISTMYFAIQSAAENNIPILILDRPNPINGERVDGPLTADNFQSFVAIAKIPIVHGMTVGELAKLFNEEDFIKTERRADLKVIKMKNWEREMYYDETGLPWIKPSPNMPFLETALVYPGLCLIEGTNVSEGRGTQNPFLQIGAPYIDQKKLIEKLDSYNLEGIKYNSIEYTPIEIPNMSSKPKHEGKICNGIELQITDRNNFDALKFGIILIHSIMHLHPDDFEFRKGSIDRLSGSENLRTMLTKGFSPEQIFNTWQNELEEFKLLRKKYLIYN